MSDDQLWTLAKQSTTDLLDAYRARLAWLETEKAGASAKAIRQALESAEIAIGAASHAIHDLMTAQTRRERNHIKTIEALGARRDAIVQPLLNAGSAPLDTFAAHRAQLGLGIAQMMHQNLLLTGQIEDFALLTFTLMCQNGVLVLQVENLAAPAFLEAVVNGFADMLLASTPLTDIGVIVLRALEAASEAAQKRRDNANDYLTALEIVTESCHVWAYQVSQYVERLNAVSEAAASQPT